MDEVRIIGQVIASLPALIGWVWIVRGVMQRIVTAWLRRRGSR